MRFKERFKKGSERQRKAEKDVLPFSERVVTVFKEMRLREFLFLLLFSSEARLERRTMLGQNSCNTEYTIFKMIFLYKYKCRREPMLNTTAKIPEHIIKRIQHIRKRERRKNTTKPPSQDAIQTITVLLNNTIYITTAVLSRAKNSMNKHAHTSCSKSFWNPWINKLKPCKCSVI